MLSVIVLANKDITMTKTEHVTINDLVIFPRVTYVCDVCVLTTC